MSDIRAKIKDAISGHDAAEAVSAMLIEMGCLGENMTADRWMRCYSMAKHDLKNAKKLEEAGNE